MLRESFNLTSTQRDWHYNAQSRLLELVLAFVLLYCVMEHTVQQHVSAAVLGLLRGTFLVLQGRDDCLKLGVSMLFASNLGHGWEPVLWLEGRVIFVCTSVWSG
jgi:hypothetical protein